MKQNFDPKKIEETFSLVSKVKENLLQGALNAAMANLIMAIENYLSTPMLKKERDFMEAEVFDLELKIAAHPKFRETYGPVSFVRGEHKMAVDFMRQLIEVAAENLKEKIEQGKELLEAGQLEAARNIFWGVMDSPACDLDDFIEIGDSYLKKSLWKEAQEVFARAAEREPESINLLNRLAISLRKDKKFADALAIYRKAVLLSPADEGLYFNLARLFMDWKKYDNAGQALRKALAIKPDFPAAVNLLNSVQECLSGGDYQDPAEA